MSQTEAPWSALKRFTFRVGFSYFAFLIAASLLDGGYATRGPLRAINNALTRLLPAMGISMSGLSPDTSLTLLRFGLLILASLMIALVWSGLDYRRPHYRALYAGVRVVLRYLVGVTMLLYGGFKLIPAQFPPLTLSQIAEPLGNFTPMGLLWAFMGFSAPYTIFAGLAEFTGGALLFSRRTTTLGALIVLGVMSNVAMMNWSYDVPVKGLSTNLVLMALVLLAPDVSRLIALFVRNEAVAPADLGRPIMRPWLRRTRAILKPLIIALAALGPLTASYSGFIAARTHGPLYGLYDVDMFALNGDTLPPVRSDARRWRRVIIDVRGSLSISRMNDASTVFAARVDTARHEISWWRPGENVISQQFGYAELSAGRLRLEGVSGGDAVVATLRRVPPDSMYRLLRVQ